MSVTSELHEGHIRVITMQHGKVNALPVQGWFDVGTALDEAGRRAIAGLIADELVDPASAFAGRVVPTLRGRLLADIVVHRLLGA